MEFAMRSCRFCSEQIFADSTRCIYCLKEAGGAKALTLLGKTKQAALPFSFALATSLAVSSFFRAPIQSTISEPIATQTQTAVGAVTTLDSSSNLSAFQSAQSPDGFNERMARDSIEEMGQTILRNPKDYLAYEGRGWVYFKELGEGLLPI